MKTRTENWSAVARGAVERKPSEPGKPKGKLELLVQFENEWSRIPNTLLEDASGHLWLAHCTPHAQWTPELIEATAFEAADVVGALTWIQNVSDLCDGYDGDVADVCRIALAELARRPSPVDLVKRAVAEEMKARTNPRRARKDKRT